MFVCVCKNISEEQIKEELNNGKNTKDIIKKFDCLQCKLCIPYIKGMCKRNAGVVERYTQKI